MHWPLYCKLISSIVGAKNWSSLPRNLGQPGQEDTTMSILRNICNQSNTVQLSPATLNKPVDMGHIWPKYGDDMA